MRILAIPVTLFLSLAASGPLTAQADHVGHGFGEVLRIKAMVQQDSLYRNAPRDTTLLLLIERDDTGRMRVVGTDDPDIPDDGHFRNVSCGRVCEGFIKLAKVVGTDILGGIAGFFGSGGSLVGTLAGAASASTGFMLADM